MCIGEATVKCYVCDSITSTGCGDPIKPDHINIPRSAHIARNLVTLINVSELLYNRN